MKSGHRKQWTHRKTDFCLFALKQNLSLCLWLLQIDLSLKFAEWNDYNWDEWIVFKADYSHSFVGGLHFCRYFSWCVRVFKRKSAMSRAAPSQQWHSLYLHVDVLLFFLVIFTDFKGNSRSFDCLYVFEIGYPAAILKDQSHILLLIKRSVFIEDHDPHWFASFTLTLSPCVCFHLSIYILHLFIMWS